MRELLFDAVEHLKPTILTGLPIGKWAAPQKIDWAAEHFPGVPIITCMARDKHKHMQPGDVLVDDRENHRAAYEAAGVVFIHHKNAAGQRQAAGENLSVGEGVLEPQAACWTSTFSTHSGQNTGSRPDQPGAVAALSLIDWSRIRRRSG